MSKFSCFSLCNPTNKTCNWNCIYVGSTNSKPPGPIIMIDQSEILSRSQFQFITLFFGCAQLCCALYQPWQAARIWCKIFLFSYFEYCQFWLNMLMDHCLLRNITKLKNKTLVEPKKLVWSSFFFTSEIFPKREIKD